MDYEKPEVTVHDLELIKDGEYLNILGCHCTAGGARLIAGEDRKPI